MAQEIAQKIAQPAPKKKTQSRAQEIAQEIAQKIAQPAPKKTTN